MKYRIYLVLLIISLFSGQSALAEDRLYRVELLVLRHLDGFSELSPQATLRDFSDTLDLLKPPELAADPETTIPGETAANPAEPEQVGTEDSAEEPSDTEPQIVLLETQSDTMQRAWQRLRSSAGFRPELYLSWQQSDAEASPSIRVHDQQILIEDDPYADLRMDPASGEDDEIPVFGDSGATESETGTGDNAGGGESDGTAPGVPEPIRYYRIDGSASLRKTRFLHLDLDIEYREPVTGGAELARPGAMSDPQRTELPAPSAFLVHTLHQDRQVQTHNLEYFDGPVIAVLALVSRVEAATDQDQDVDRTNE